MADEEYRMISEKFYQELIERSTWLAALEAAGVDNWEGYDVAFQVLNGEDPF